MTSAPTCPVCRGQDATTFLVLDGQPVLIGLLWEDAASARACRRGDIELAFCPECGFVWNTRFDPNKLDYTQKYDNSLHFSGTFQRYTQEIVDRLVREHDLRHKVVVDIGCGKGDFLHMLCEAGDNRGHGFDPSYEGARDAAAGDDRVTFSTEYYGEAHSGIPADLVASRFVFEHIPDPRAFLSMLRRTLGDRYGTVVYFEVPNIDLIVRQGSVWDVIYEHCSYFGPESLTRVFEECGFDVVRVDEGYSRQFLSIEARPSRSNPAPVRTDPAAVRDLADAVETFSREQEEKRREWEDKLSLWRRQGKSVAAWGAGAKAVGFLNMLASSDVVDRVVDINPFKQDKFLAGSGQRIIAPDALVQSPPDLIVLMNPVYRQEVEATLAELGLEVEIVNA